MSTLNSLDQDQARHFVGPDLGPNCLQKLSADNTRDKELRTLHATQRQITKARLRAIHARVS